MQSGPCLRLYFCGFTGRDVTDPQQASHSYVVKETDRDRAFVVAVLKLWSKLSAIPSVTRDKFSSYKRVSLFIYLCCFTSISQNIV